MKHISPVTILWIALIPGLAVRAQVTTVAPVSGQPYTTLTPKDRWHLYVKNVANPIAIVASSASAGFGQWRDSPTEWGQGGSGYGRRFASSYANHVVDASVLWGASSLLHEDNRYVSSPQRGMGPRIRYAVLSTFVARRNDGTRKVAIARIGALAAAALISRSWQPESTRSIGNAASSFGVSIAVSTGFHVAQEFLPALFHRE